MKAVHCPVNLEQASGRQPEIDAELHIFMGFDVNA